MKAGLSSTTSSIGPRVRHFRLRLSIAAILAASLLFLAGTAIASGWELQSSGTTVDLHGVTASHSSIQVAWACGDQGTILHTTNGGASWAQQNSGTDRDLYGIAFQELALGPVIAVGEGGIILRTSNSGATWQQIESGTTQTLRSISDFSQVACGDLGTVLHSTDEGLTWLTDAIDTQVDLHAAHGGAIRQVVGDAGALFIKTTSMPWQPRDSGTDLALYGLPMFSANRIMVGDAGTILLGNGGWSFTPVTSGTSAAIRSVQYSQNNTERVYAVGDDGVILKSTNHGATWNRQIAPTSQDLTSTFFYLDDQRGWAVGRGGTILRTNDGGGPLLPVAAVAEPRVNPGLPHLTIAPHPATAESRFSFELPRPGPARVEIFDLTGRRILSWSTPELAGGTQAAPLSISPLPAGVYHYRLTLDSGVGTGRLVRR